MAFSEQQNLNKSQGKEIRVACLRCHGRTNHVVLVSVDREGSEGQYGVDWNETNQIVQCLGCQQISFRVANMNSEDYDHDSDGNLYYLETELLYPHRLEGQRNIGQETDYLPENVQNIYKETLQALVSNLPVLAGIGLRALIETVCKEKNAIGKDLNTKIDDLLAKGVLNPAGAEVLHHIRTLGNAAAHEVKPHSKRRLVLALEVVEHLLRDVYILPAKAKAEFQRMK
jgi:hypothetical protein